MLKLTLLQHIKGGIVKRLTTLIFFLILAPSFAAQSSAEFLAEVKTSQMGEVQYGGELSRQKTRIRSLFRYLEKAVRNLESEGILISDEDDNLINKAAIVVISSTEEVVKIASPGTHRKIRTINKRALKKANQGLASMLTIIKSYIP